MPFSCARAPARESPSMKPRERCLTSNPFVLTGGDTTVSAPAAPGRPAHGRGLLPARPAHGRGLLPARPAHGRGLLPARPPLTGPLHAALLSGRGNFAR